MSSLIDLIYKPPIKPLDFELKAFLEFVINYLQNISLADIPNADKDLDRWEKSFYEYIDNKVLWANRVDVKNASRRIPMHLRTVINNPQNWRTNPMEKLLQDIVIFNDYIISKK
jgi:hypothetical protein